MARRIIVTGSAGFIGFHVAQALLARGDRVLGVDSINDYYPVSIKHARHAMLTAQHADTFEPLVYELADTAGTMAAVERFRPDVVCHLAAQAGVRYSLTHPHAYVQANLVAFVNLLEACRHHGVQRLVYASSSSVYGGNTQLPFSVADRVDSPISLYAATKKSNELLAHCYSHLFGLQTVGLRFFTVYGPWGRPDMMMWIFTEKILAGEPIPVFNHGKMRRDFTYIDDIVQGVLASIDRPGLAPYEVFNLGNHRCEELMDVVGLLATALGREPEVRMMEMQPGDVPATWADIEREREVLGFSPETPVSDGVPRFVEWYRAHPDLAADAREWRRSQG
ncbi:MAG: NAD-dependent epimerase/dehydratase family protein [Planctomycetota bacterium]